MRRGGDDSVGYGADQESEQTGKLDANGKLTITVPTSLDSTEFAGMDEDYTVEAGVTDAANREVTGPRAISGDVREFSHPRGAGELCGAAGCAGEVQRDGGGL